RGSPDNSVQFLDDFCIQITVPEGQFPHLGFEFLHGLVAGFARTSRKIEAQERIAACIGRDLRFLGTQIEAELAFENLPHKSQRLLRLLGGLAEDDEIVGIPRKAVVGGFQPPVQLVQHDVRKQGRNDSPLRRADQRGLKFAFFHDSGSEKSFDQVQDVPIRHFFSHRVHDNLVRQVVEEPLDIGIEYDRVPLSMEFQDSLKRLVTVPVGNESEGSRVKLGFEDRRQEESDDFLSDAIPNDRNAEATELRRSGTFGNVQSAQGEGLVSTRLEFPHERVEILIELILEHLNADLVDSRSTAIPLDRPESFVHQRKSNPSGERMKLDFLGHCYSRQVRACYTHVLTKFGPTALGVVA